MFLFRPAQAGRYRRGCCRLPIWAARGSRPQNSMSLGVRWRWNATIGLAAPRIKAAAISAELRGEAADIRYCARPWRRWCAFDQNGSSDPAKAPIEIGGTGSAA